MHLNFLGLPENQGFASSLRSKLLASRADKLLAELTITNTQDRCLLLVQLATCLLGGHAASSASKFKMII